jgi:hypothetical protein
MDTQFYKPPDWLPICQIMLPAMEEQKRCFLLGPCRELIIEICWILPNSLTGPPCSWRGPGRGVSDVSVKYGYGSCATRTSEWLHCKLQIRPLIRECASFKNQGIARPKQRKWVIWSWAPKEGPTPRQAGRLTVGSNIDDDGQPMNLGV